MQGLCGKCRGGGGSLGASELSACPSSLSLCLDSLSMCMFLGLGPAREGKTTLAEPNVVHKRKVSHVEI